MFTNITITDECLQGVIHQCDNQTQRKKGDTYELFSLFIVHRALQQQFQFLELFLKGRSRRVVAGLGVRNPVPLSSPSFKFGTDIDNEKCINFVSGVCPHT